MPVRQLSPVFARRIARTALDSVVRRWPYQTAHPWSGPDDVRRPEELHPIFNGCYDWHSAVHSHWALARLLDQGLLDATTAYDARCRLVDEIIPLQAAVERAYFDERPSFEWPYGWAWLLMLTGELLGSDDAGLKAAGEALRPLADTLSDRVGPRLTSMIAPVRTGTHSNTAFAMELFWDAAPGLGRDDLRDTVADHGERFFGSDVAYPWAYEPSAYDFLSAGLSTIGLLRRIRAPESFSAWLEAFGAPDDRDLAVVESLDPADGWLAHLIGLNLSRAWELRALAAHLPAHPRAATWRDLAHGHRAAAHAGLFSGHYEGDHWLGTFALYGA